MPGMFSINLRVYRVFGFGGARRGSSGAGAGGRPQTGAGGSGNPGGPGGFGGGGFSGGGSGRGGRGGGGFASETTDHRFNLTIGVNCINVLNHFNPAGYQGVLTSTQFGQPTTVNTGFGGGGFATGVNTGGIGAGAVTTGPMGTVANNRRIELEVRFTF